MSFLSAIRPSDSEKIADSQASLVDFINETGGSAWESNPPRTFLPVTGFEVQEAHQNLSTSNLQIN